MASERFDAGLEALLSGQSLPIPTATSTSARVLQLTRTSESDLCQMTDRLAIFWEYREQSPETAEAYWLQVQRNIKEAHGSVEGFEATVLRALHVMGVVVDDDIRSIAPYVDPEHRT